MLLKSIYHKLKPGCLVLSQVILRWASGVAQHILLQILGHGVLILVRPTTVAYSAALASAPTVAIVGGVWALGLLLVLTVGVTFSDWKTVKFGRIEILPEHLRLLHAMWAALISVLGVAVLRHNNYDTHPLLDLNHAARVGAVAGAANFFMMLGNTEVPQWGELVFGVQVAKVEEETRSISPVSYVHEPNIV
ncbi:hypothetical protein B0H16DRAFT_1821732 [Mycena metata]|uniref:Uncharacterized protein n=1 Tax=Mycena metata TaxID=1033252 RepID=A0AAD7NF59_9AGAR|nr:hypothetical protein B0H16DRAFT_1821732 [Mycena metata]